MKPLLLALILIITTSSPISAFPQKKTEPRTVVPKIARLLGVRVGYNGQKALERTFGPGTRSIGGHPNGRESWRTQSPRGSISTDGFSDNDEGLILEQLEWTTPLHNEALPLVKKMPKNSGWMGIVNLGMTTEQVEKLTAKILPKPKKEDDIWTWTAKGYLRPKYPHLQDPYRDWTASLRFDKKRLVGIELTCQ